MYTCRARLMRYGYATRIQRKYLSDMGTGSGDFRRPLSINVIEPTEVNSTGLSNSNIDDTKNPWEVVKNEEGIYYWNKHTNETTPVGAGRPEHWVERSDPSGQTQLTYWWNPDTDATTALGTMNPNVGNSNLQTRNFNQSASNNNPMSNQPTQSLGSSLKTYAIMGGAMAVGSMLIRSLF